MSDPFYSPKVAAYYAVLNKLKNFRLKQGIFPNDYTDQVNQEISGIKTRLNAAVRRAKGEEGIKKMCAANPEFAKTWEELKLQNGYLNAIKRKNQLAKKIDELRKLSSVQSDLSDQSDQNQVNENEHPSDPHN